MFTVFYFCLGFCLTLPEIALRLYGRDELLLQPAQINSFYTLTVLPWGLKPLYGLVSDTFGYKGQRRRPYILVGCVIGSLGYALLAILPAKPTVALGCLITSMTGVVAADVASDSLVVETVKRQSADEKGKLQSKTTMARFAGALVASALSGVSLSIVQPRVVFACASAPLLLVFIFAYRYKEAPIDDTLYGRIDERFEGTSVELEEDGTIHVQSRVLRLTALRIRLRRLVDTFRHPHMTRPLSFLLLLMCMPSCSTAMFYYMTEKLHFDPEFLSVLSVLRHACGWCGAALYRLKFRTCNLRTMFVVTTLVIMCFHSLQLVLVTGANEAMGIPAKAFVIGADSADAVVESLGMLPMLVLAVKLTPAGNEGSVYCSIIAFTNLARMVGGFIGSALTDLLHITMQDFTNLWILVLITSACIPLPLLLIKRIPTSV